MIESIITEINKAYKTSEGDKQKFFFLVLVDIGLKREAFRKGILCDYIESKTWKKEAQNARAKF